MPKNAPLQPYVPPSGVAGRLPRVLAPLRCAARAAAVEAAVALALSLFVAAVVPHATPALTVPSQGTAVCGTAQMTSPYNYNGATGSYTSGTAGLPTFGTAGSDFPSATAGVVWGPGQTGFQAFQLAANTVYYAEPGTDFNGYQLNAGDAVVGGYAGGTGVTFDGQYSTNNKYAFDSNSANGNQAGVTIEYVTITHYMPEVENAAVNSDGNTGWTEKFDTFTANLPGAALRDAAGSDTEHDCLTANGQYGINVSQVNGFGTDTLTGGPYGVTISNDEISYNDMCDIEGTITNAAAGYAAFNPVPAQLRNSHCLDYGALNNNGNYGGLKLWQTNGVRIENDWIHDNYGVAGWADTNDANTTWNNDFFSNNDLVAIQEEISYNFSITNSTFVNNDLIGGLGNPGFPQPAIYVSESGSDSIFGGIPACSEPACAGFPSYTSQSVISDNVLENNGGGIFLWENSNRYCGSGIDTGVCTLVAPSTYTLSSCTSNFATANLNLTTFAGQSTGSPAANYWDGCQWETENVAVTGNLISFIPSKLPGCNATAWSFCGANGIFSQYATPRTAPGYAAASMITFWRGNTWSNNTYSGPDVFYAWNQGQAGPVTWAQWTGATSGGDKCSSAGETTSGHCAGPFGQDSGSATGAAFTSPSRGHAGSRRSR